MRDRRSGTFDEHGEIAPLAISVYQTDRMRPILPIVTVLLLLAPETFAQRDVTARQRDVWNADAPLAASPRDTAVGAVKQRAASFVGGEALELEPPRERASLTGSHFFFAQTVGGIPVLNAGVAVSVHRDGRMTLHDRTGRPRRDVVRIGEAEAIATAIATGRILGAAELERADLVAWANDDGEVRSYRRVILYNGLRRHAVFVDAVNGRVGWTEPLFMTAQGRVFDSNPVTSLNDPSLLDGDDSDASVPSAAYALVDLEGLGGDGPLWGPRVTIVDVEIPTTTRAEQPLPSDLTRSRDEFEEVNAYFQIDRSQRYLQSLGFVAERAIVDYPIEIDAHAAGGADESSYRFTIPGRGRLYFGDGGVDDAEDADILLHEFGHAIQDSIVPSGFTGPSASEPRALGEGFSDYWAFSASWAHARASGRDPYCIGDWDARCAPGPSTRCGYDPGADCLRRVDGTKTMSDYLRAGGSGTEHRNGEIWASALREIFVKSVAAAGDDEGRRALDRTILESHFGLPPNPSFHTAALRLIDADRRLNSGTLTPAICTAMSSRLIVDASDCDLGLRGDLTLVESPARDVAIPDNSSQGVSATLRVSDTRVAEEILVRVHVAHPRRGDLRLTLTAPDGTSAVLQVENGDSGADIKAVYGLDAEPSQPLATLVGKSAAGTWTLHITDTFGADEGRLVSWGMMFRFAGDAAITTRGTSDSTSIILPVVGSVAGALGSHFVTDARVANVGASTARATMFFTPSGEDGTTTFSAVRIEIPSGEIVALDDFVASLFRESGTGTVEIRGDTGNLVVTSRIHNDTEAGTSGQFVRPATGFAGAAALAPLDVIHLSNDTGTRSNLGVTEGHGGSGRVEVTLLDPTGATIGIETLDITPYSHLQIPLLGGVGGTTAASFRAEVRVLSGAASVVAYGSVVDNASGDAIFIPGSFMGGAPFSLPDEPYVIPAVIRGDGANGTRWRSDVRILNRGSDNAVEVTFTPADGSPALSQSIELGAGTIATIDDVLQSLFWLSEGRGSLSVSLADSSTSLVELVVTSRTWTPGPAGSYGQFIPAVPRSESTRRGDTAVSLIHVDSNPGFRTNVGLTEVDGRSVVVRMRLLDASGSERWATNVAVAPSGNIQFNPAAAGAPIMSNARLTFEVVAGDGAVLPYASVVDNASGDPIFISR